MTDQAKERAIKQTAELKEKGYYTLENGSKSTDEANKHLLKVKKPKVAPKTNSKSAIEKEDDDDEEEKFVHPPPKRPGSSWLYFNTEFCKKFVEEGGERIKAFKAASDKWNAISEEEKQPYNNMASNAKTMVDSQIAELAKKGYYTLENGSKSTDEANAHLLKVKKPKTKRAAKVT